MYMSVVLELPGDLIPHRMAALAFMHILSDPVFFPSEMVENTGQRLGRQLHTGKSLELGGDNTSVGALDVGVGRCR